MNSEKRKTRIVVYITVMVVSFLIPFVLAFVLLRSVPERYVLSGKWFSPDRSTINLEALKADSRFENVERLKNERFKDFVLFTMGKEILRIATLSPSVTPSKALEMFDAQARAMKEKNGVKPAGSQSSSVGGEGDRLTRFEDGTVSYTRSLAGAVFQVIGKDSTDVSKYFENIGWIEENKALSGTQGWLAENKVLLIVCLALIFSVFWLVWILRGGAWVAVADPQEGAVRVSPEELSTRILRVNQFDVPFRVSQKGDHLTAEWRLDGKWQGVLESEKIDHLFTLDMKMNESRGSVSTIEHKRKVVKETGVWGLRVQFEFFRGITLKSYESGATYGLSFIDGDFKLTGYQWRFNLQEMKNPLIEVVTRSGWKWEPHILFL